MSIVILQQFRANVGFRLETICGDGSLIGASSIRDTWWTACKLCITSDTDDEISRVPTSLCFSWFPTAQVNYQTRRENSRKLDKDVQYPRVFDLGSRDRISNHLPGLSTPLKQLRPLVASFVVRAPPGARRVAVFETTRRNFLLPCGHRVKSLRRTLYNPTRPGQLRFTSNFTRALR